MQAWVVPAVLGTVVFLGALGIAQLVPPHTAPEPTLVALFPQVSVDAAAPGTLLAVWNGSAPDSGPLVQAPVVAPGPVAWEGRPLAEAASAGPGLRFGHGANATVLTFYAFTADGRLLATDAPPEDYARFHRHKEFRHLEPAAFYLGAGAAPNGTVALPGPLAGLAPLLRDALAGQPAGGVAVVRLDHGLVATFYGPVTVGARVERLVPDP